MTQLDASSTTCLGTVWVQPDGNVPPKLTLHVFDGRFGIVLCDANGTMVMPKSPRLGFHSSHKEEKRWMLVCDDDVSDETRERLIKAGYAKVIARP